LSSVALSSEAVERLQHRVLNLYTAVMLLMLVTIGLLVVYALRLGPLIGPGVESSFGLDLALLFISSAILVHIVDQTYRVWPLGRSVLPAFPGLLTDRGYANALRVLVLVAAAVAIAYVFATVLTS
jgi:hypothetical protein